MQTVDEKDQRIKQLEHENKKLQEEVNRLEHNVEALTQAILQASKQRFGASSEKTPPNADQFSLFDEEDADNLPLPYAPVIPIKAHQRPIRQKGDREKLIQQLARETVECVLNPEESVCGICGNELKIIGKKKVRSEMVYILFHQHFRAFSVNHAGRFNTIRVCFFLIHLQSFQKPFQLTLTDVPHFTLVLRPLEFHLVCK